ncbi:MAG TPA: asparagine synthase (glutamine-hydrolyzing) [Hanamia sp.]|nr:asparagine synthase (glutamine-hydrolyzing) [Hanamia sp.]
MCRISGIINQSIPTVELKAMVKEMCCILKHGGPDDEGIFGDDEQHLVLGHRRLSLIDLSDCGHQPMSFADGQFVITFNGEIYNYQELKEELKKEGVHFSTESDTEVILAAFAQWGTGSFDKLNGMFAFALRDKENHKLYLVRDASGIKPLYYAITKQGLAFASEIRGFKPIPYLQEENKVWPVYLMAYGHLPEPVTVLNNVLPLEKGSFLSYDLKSGKTEKVIFKKYFPNEKIIKREEAIFLLKESLQQAVLRHLIADAPIGVFLSGGLDSSIVSLLANSDQQTKLNTLSLFFEEEQFSEKKYQDILLEQMQCKRKQHLLKQNEFHQHLPAIIAAMDQPSCDGINTWFISKYAKENGLKAVLSGIGSDELYGGYPSFRRVSKAIVLENLPGKLLKSGKYAGLKRMKRLGYLALGGAAGKYLFLRGQFMPYEIAEKLNMPEEEVWNILKTHPANENIDQLNAYNQASWIERNLFMQNQLLRDVDVMSMSHGIEIRIPFLDKEFVDLSMQISSPTKAAGKLPKQLLIDSFKNILPEAIWNRPKMGFGFPFKEWLANDEFMKSLIRPDEEDYQSLTSGNRHWSQFLSLALIKNRGISTSVSRVQKSFRGNQSETGSRNILFLTLRTFSKTGGIEKVSKVAGKALYELCEESGGKLKVCSMYDAKTDSDEKYFPKRNFTGFGIQKLKFSFSCIYEGVHNETVILTHINLLPIGFMIKILSSKTRLVLITHGIEAWPSFHGLKRRMLRKCDEILSVSNYTKAVISKRNGFPNDNIRVLNNCLDPFLELPVVKGKDEALLEKYGIEKGDTVLMTLTRLASRERYKGYDIVIESLQKLREAHPELKYLIVGKYDAKEKERLDVLIHKAGLTSQVIFAGFVPDAELADHFNLADIYIMPSEKEGFGIVFIEAMYYNKPVIAGNKDGSTDALLDGKLGLLVDPQSQEEVRAAITKMILDKERYLPDQKLLMEHFSYPVYKEKWREILQG